MNRSNRSSLAAGLLLILLGAWFLVAQWVPGLQNWFSWPLIVVGVGVVLLLWSLLAGVPGLAVPASIVGGLGALLYWQNATGYWESWTYVWTLIPGFVGVGAVLAGLFGRDGRQARDGATLILISLVMFAVLGAFLGPLDSLSPYWPVVLIALGLWGLARSLLWRR